MARQMSEINVLLIEDDEDEHVIIRDYLLEASNPEFNVDWAKDIDSGLEAVSTGKYDVCLLDYFLGDRNGLDFIREAALRGFKTPIIFITGWENQETDFQAMKEGASDYLVKGEINPSILERSIRYAIERNRYQNRLEEMVHERTAALIKEKEKAERNAERYRSVFENSLDGIMLTSPDGQILSANPEACRILGYTEEEIRRLGRKGIVDPAHPNLPTLLSERKDTGRCRGELEYIRKDGSRVPVEVSSSVFGEPNGEEKNILVFRDIAERKQAEKALHESEENARQRLNEIEAIYRSAPVGLCVLDENLRYVRVNDRLAEINGLPAERHIGKTPREVVPGLADSAELVAEKVFRTGKSAKAELSGVIGNEPEARQHLVHWLPLKDHSGRVVAVNVVVDDITERKQIENALKEAREELERRVRERTAELEKAKANLEESELRFKEVLETSLDVSYRRNLKADRYDYISPGIEKLLGRPPQEMISMSAARAFSLLHPFDSKRLEQEISKAESEGKEKHLSEYRARLTDGGYRWFSELISFVRDAEGKPLYRVGSIRDVTERKLAEEALRAYASRLETLNRDLEDFAFVAAHDLQEPLRKVQVFSDIVAGRYAQHLNDEGRNYLKRLAHSANRMQKLIQEMRSYSKLTSKQPSFERVELKEIVEEALLDLEVKVEETGANVQVGELPSIEADPQLMRIVFQNLLENALKYRSDDAPEIAISSRKLGENLQITVQDNGIGFDDRRVDRIFKPFKRLHGRKEYEGTGMGLAICRKIVERHGGSISAKSAPGKGSAFRVTLPLKRRMEEQSLRERDLRERAEREVSPPSEWRREASPGDPQWLDMELSVHRIELEMQNEELRKTQAECESLRDRYYDFYNKVPVGYVILKPTGMITDINQTGFEILGLKSRHLRVEIPLSRFVAPHHQERYYGHINALKKTGARQGCYIEMVDLEGKPFRGLLTSVPEKDETGRLSLIRIAITDITRR